MFTHNLARPAPTTNAEQVAGRVVLADCRGVDWPFGWSTAVE